MTSGTALLPWQRLGSKVSDRQLERLAVVYVRQSTRQQVLDHGESTRLQDGLVQRAVGLGWPTSRVLVIDEDLASPGPARSAGWASSGWSPRSPWACGAGAGHRDVASGALGRRLVQLLELCALSGALLADADGIYDPVEFNDRLLLGLKGTMSEAELHLPEAADAGRQQAKARRGELAIGLPTGYVRRVSGEAVLDPTSRSRRWCG